ncbi:MAG: glycosyltransferase [Muribaculaceae bacterium]|nr:glycosyltransferase [Muribaculaceae bacterium]
MSRKRIFWLTAGYFLDVDLPVVPALMSDFDIDWVLLTTERNFEDDARYVKSQTQRPIKMICDQGRFFSPSHYKVMKNLILDLVKKDYDLYYFDISDLLFIFPLIKKNLPIEKVVIATHNVVVPKGARYALLARLSMKYILRHFRNFQTFSLGQLEALKVVNPNANVLYAPLMLKDYGGKDLLPAKIREDEPIKFLFFGNIVRYKRLDVLLKAVEILASRGIRNFKVYICGYCPEKEWTGIYRPLISDDSLFHLDIRRIPTDKVGEYFRECQYFLMPYQDIAQSGAMTVALNYSMPIIASNLPTFHEFLTGDGDAYFFKAADAEALADCMQQAIGNSEEQYLEMRSAVAAIVEKKLSKDVILGKYKEYLDAL